jgi:hypothetical protein
MKDNKVVCKNKRLHKTCYECKETGVDCSEHVGRGSKQCRENRLSIGVNMSKYGCDCYVDLNTSAVRRAIQLILSEKSDIKLKMSEIKFIKRPMTRGLYLKGKRVYVFDRYLHYPKKIDHIYATYEFLKHVEELCGGWKHLLKGT